MELGGSCYNLACLYAVTKRLDDAFKFLEIALINKEENFDYVEKDNDWDELMDNPKYL